MNIAPTHDEQRESGVPPHLNVNVGPVTGLDCGFGASATVADAVAALVQELATRR